MEGWLEDKVSTAESVVVNDQKGRHLEASKNYMTHNDPAFSHHQYSDVAVMDDAIRMIGGFFFEKEHARMGGGSHLIKNQPTKTFKRGSSSRSF
eukprot:scaffold18583_cov160-Amphora_coffeaeformis.AAC.8